MDKKAADEHESHRSAFARIRRDFEKFKIKDDPPCSRLLGILP